MMVEHNCVLPASGEGEKKQSFPTFNTLPLYHGDSDSLRKGKLNQEYSAQAQLCSPVTGLSQP